MPLPAGIRAVTQWGKDPNGVLLSGGDGPSFSCEVLQPCSPHLVWRRGITSSRPAQLLGTKTIAWCQPAGQERGQLGEMQREPHAKSPRCELWGLQPLLCTDCSAVFPVRKVRIGRRQNQENLGMLGILVWDDAWGMSVGGLREMAPHGVHRLGQGYPWIYACSSPVSFSPPLFYTP